MQTRHASRLPIAIRALRDVEVIDDSRPANPVESCGVRVRFLFHEAIHRLRDLFSQAFIFMLTAPTRSSIC